MEIFIVKHMHCEECGSHMYVDDRDITNKDNYDIYYNCPNCATSCIRETRHKRFIKEVWHSENNGDVRDWYKKYVDKK